MRQNYTQWEGDVINLVAHNMEMTYSDATGVVDVESFAMRQAWSLGLNAEDAAKKVEASSNARS